MRKRELLGDTLIIVAGLELLVMGVIIQLMYPIGYYGQEPNSYILIGEIIMSLGILGLGIERAINDTGCCLREAIGDIVTIVCGVTLTGIFITIAIREMFYMAPIETWFIIMRAVIGIILIILGVERFNNDL